MCADKTETDQGVGPDREGTGVFRFLVRSVWFVLDQIRVTTGFGAVKPEGCWFDSRPAPCSSSCVCVASLQTLQLPSIQNAHIRLLVHGYVCVRPCKEVVTYNFRLKIQDLCHYEDSQEGWMGYFDSLQVPFLVYCHLLLTRCLCHPGKMFKDQLWLLFRRCRQLHSNSAFSWI